MGGGVLPVAFHKGKVYFLFGREAFDGKWSDFGGGKEGNETPFRTAIREGCEELNGFLGCKAELERRVKGNMIKRITHMQFHTYLFELSYDENLPIYFTNNSTFIKQRLPHLVDKKGLFEKSEIAWMTVSDIRRNHNLFRPFYKGVLREIMSAEKEIRKYFA